MKSLKTKAFGLVLLSMIAGMALTACSQEEDEPVSPSEALQNPEPPGPTSGTLEKWDDLRYFQTAIISVDENGNFLQRHNGALLNPNDTTVLYMGVRNLKEAEEEFRLFMSPDAIFQRDDSQSANLTVELQSETGESQGFVYFKEGSDDCIAEVTVSPGTQIKHFSKIVFTDVKSWPVTRAVYKKFGDVSRDYYFTCKLSEGSVFPISLYSVCVREGGPGHPSVSMAITKEEFSEYDFYHGKREWDVSTFDDIRSDWQHVFATKEKAAQLVRYMHKNYPVAKESFARAASLSREHVSYELYRSSELDDSGDKDFSGYWTSSCGAHVIYWRKRWSIIVKPNDYDIEWTINSPDFGTYKRKVWLHREG